MPYDSVDGYRMLIMAKIHRHVEDSVKPLLPQSRSASVSSLSGSEFDKYGRIRDLQDLKREARQYVMSKDFDFLCDLAGLEADILREAIVTKWEGHIFCKRGHIKAGDNLSNRGRCKKCDAINSQDSYARKKAESAK